MKAKKKVTKKVTKKRTVKQTEEAILDASYHVKRIHDLVVQEIINLGLQPQENWLMLGRVTNILFTHTYGTCFGKVLEEESKGIQ